MRTQSGIKLLSEPHTQILHSILQDDKNFHRNDLIKGQFFCVIGIDTEIAVAIKLKPVKRLHLYHWFRKLEILTDSGSPALPAAVPIQLSSLG